MVVSNTGMSNMRPSSCFFYGPSIPININEQLIEKKNIQFSFRVTNMLVRGIHHITCLSYLLINCKLINIV